MAGVRANERCRVPVLRHLLGHRRRRLPNHPGFPDSSWHAECYLVLLIVATAEKWWKVCAARGQFDRGSDLRPCPRLPSDSYLHAFWNHRHRGAFERREIDVLES